MISWLLFLHLLHLPGSGLRESSAEEAVQWPDLYWLYYWNHHTSTWWAALAASFGTLSGAALAAWLLSMAERFVFARSKILGVLVAVLGWLGWLCGAAFLTLLTLVVWLGIDAEGTQTKVTGPDGKHVLVTVSNNGYDWVRVWQQDTFTRYVKVPGEATVDPSSGPCTLTESGELLILRCGTSSQTLKP